MIRINLLPFRAARTKENIRRQVSVYILLLILIGVIMTSLSLHFKAQVGREESEVNQLQVELNKYKKQARQVDDINKKNKMLQTKIDIIEELQEVRKSPVLALGELTEVVIPERIWVSSYVESGSLITINGYALDEITVADFTEKLETLPHYEKTTLKYLRHETHQKLPLKKFEMTCMRSKSKPKSSNATGMKVK